MGFRTLSFTLSTEQVHELIDVLETYEHGVPVTLTYQGDGSLVVGCDLATVEITTVGNTFLAD